MNPAPVFYKGWNAPTVKDVATRNPEKSKDGTLAHLCTAIASHQMMEEDPLEHMDLKAMGCPELEEFLPLLDEMSGDPYEKGIKFSVVVKEVASSLQNIKQYEKSHPEYVESLKNKIKQECLAPGQKTGPREDRPFMSGPTTATWKQNEPSAKMLLALSTFDLLRKYSYAQPKNNVEGKPPQNYDLRAARCIGDLKYCSRRDLAMPDDLFWLKFMQRQIMVKIPLTPVEEKMEIVILLDDSGSMDEPVKIKWVTGLLNTIFQAVEEDKAIVYFASFQYERSPFVKIETSADVALFKSKFRAGSSGGTYLDNILPALAGQITSGKIDNYTLSNLLDILIINDGQDSVPHELNFPVKIHAVSVEEFNEDLKEMCNHNGGNYYQTDRAGAIQLL